LFGTAIPAFGVVAFAAPRMVSFLDTLCDRSSASVASSCISTAACAQLHGHSCMGTAACAQLHAHSCMRTAACAQLHGLLHAHSSCMGTAACAQLHAHSRMRTAPCAQPHAHSCMLTAACAQPFNTQDAVETWIGIPVILVEPSGSQLSAVDQQPSDIVSNKMRIGCAFSGLEL